jgi:hypothetical protein
MSVFALFRGFKHAHELQTGNEITCQYTTHNSVCKLASFPCTDTVATTTTVIVTSLIIISWGMRNEDKEVKSYINAHVITLQRFSCKHHVCT